jgi:transposase
MISTKKNRRVQIAIDDAIYALRNRIERCFNRLKNARRVATLYDKLADTFLGFIHLVAVRLWLPHFVNAA